MLTRFASPVAELCNIHRLSLTTRFFADCGHLALLYSYEKRLLLNYLNTKMQNKLDVNINYSGFCYWSDRSVTDVEYIIMSDSTKKSY